MDEDYTPKCINLVTHVSVAERKIAIGRLEEEEEEAKLPLSFTSRFSTE